MKMNWKIALLLGIAVVSAGIWLYPKIELVRENAKRINDLSNLHGIYKAMSNWGLDPGDSSRPPFPPSLDKLVKENKITQEILVSYTGKPIEYYPASDDADGNCVLLVSHGNGGRNVVRASGSGLWVDDGTPEAAAIDRQLVKRKKHQMTRRPHTK